MVRILVLTFVILILVLISFWRLLHASSQTYEKGYASWYGLSPELDGNPMANGIPYDPWNPTIAATPLWFDTTVPLWPLGTRIRVCRNDAVPPLQPNDLLAWWGWPWCTGILTIQDTCPGCGFTLPARIWVDLSPGAFKYLASRDTGLVPVSIEVIQ